MIEKGTAKNYLSKNEPGESGRFVEKIYQFHAGEIPLLTLIDIFGDHYNEKLAKFVTSNRRSGDRLNLYNPHSTELIYIDRGSIKINGVEVKVGEIIRIDPGEIYEIDVDIDVEVKSLFFPYIAHLFHVEHSQIERCTPSRPLVSIVIIAKDIENYICHAVSSCIQQSYSNIQIIIVDDGSSDGTLNKCSTIASFDKRIEFYSKSLGVNGVRKFGVDKARGEYCLIIDGDDWINHDAVERLEESAREHQSDLIAFGFDHFSDKLHTRWSPIFPSDQSLQVHPMYFDASERNAHVLSQLNHTIWMYFFSINLKSYAIEALIAVHQYEDLPFFITLLQHAKRPFICNQILYHYRRDRVGQTTENWTAVEVGQKQLYLESAVRHALNLIDPDDWFHQLILLYKFKNMIDYEWALCANSSQVFSQDSWDHVCYRIMSLFPKSLERRIMVSEVRDKFLARDYFYSINSHLIR